MSAVNIQEYIPTIRQILKESDLKKITAKDVRVKLQEVFKVDLTSHKPEVQHLVEQCFDELDVSEDEEYEEKKKNPHKKPIKPKGRPRKSKSEKTNASEYSSLEDDHPPERKRKHKKSNGQKVDVSDATGEDVKKPKSKTTPKKKKNNKRKKNDEIDDGDDGEGAPKKKKANTGIHKPLLLSPVLSEFLGVEELSRLDVVKRLWTYIKANELQDPKDKRFIICDEKLEQIFGKDRMHSFTMNKYLTAHLKKKEDIVGNGFGFIQKDLEEGDDREYETAVKFDDHDADATAVKFEDADEFSGDQGDGPIKMEDEFSIEGEGSVKTEDLFGPDDEDYEDNVSIKNESPE